MTPDPLEPLRTNTKTPLPPEGGASGFEKIFAVYPKKANRAKAARRWMRIAPNAATQDLMMVAIAAQHRTSGWSREQGRFVPELSTWLRNACWLDDVGGIVAADWWTDTDSIKAMGSRHGIVFTLDALGNAYTDDVRQAHWQSYRRRVFAASGAGPWSEGRAA